MLVYLGKASDGAICADGDQASCIDTSTFWAMGKHPFLNKKDSKANDRAGVRMFPNLELN